MDLLKELEAVVNENSIAPTLEAMPRNTLSNKGIAGPTGAHMIEEIHTPFNFSYVTLTTGTTAYQNITGVTAPELPERVTASQRALTLAGISVGDHMLLSYPPLVSVFPKEALELYGVTWSFLKSSSRDALLLALCKDRPRVVVGESSFLRATIESAKKMGMAQLLPQNTIFLAAGTPLDLDFVTIAQDVMNARVHDLYGCQEFGWLALDGIPLRDDITLMQTKDPGYSALLVGGLPTGDCFPISDAGHCCNSKGSIITYSRIRDDADLETIILETTAHGRDTVLRLAKTILRIKAKIVRVSPNLVLSAPRTLVSVHPYGSITSGTQIEGPKKTRMLDTLLQAQLEYQSSAKNDPAWIKGR